MVGSMGRIWIGQSSWRPRALWRGEPLREMASWMGPGKTGWHSPDDFAPTICARRLNRNEGLSKMTFKEIAVVADRQERCRLKPASLRR